MRVSQEHPDVTSGFVSPLKIIKIKNEISVINVQKRCLKYGIISWRVKFDFVLVGRYAHEQQLDYSSRSGNDYQQEKPPLGESSSHPNAYQ